MSAGILPSPAIRNSAACVWLGLVLRLRNFSPSVLQSPPFYLSTIAVATVPEDHLEPLRSDEVLCARFLHPV